MLINHRPRIGQACTVLAVFTFIIASLALGPSIANAQAASTYYVDGSSTTGPCSDSYIAAQAQSPQTPWCTISEAVASVPSGSTINVAPAVYHEQVQ